MRAALGRNVNIQFDASCESASQCCVITTLCYCVANRFFTDAYDLFVIGLVKPMFGIVYYPQNNGKLPLHIDLWVTGIALAGTLLGQVGTISARNSCII